MNEKTEIKIQALEGEVLLDKHDSFAFNVNQLQVGQEFKNYKTLCDFLETSTKTGKSKQIQLKEWQRHFTYEKQGNKFIILEIHYNKLERVDNRKNNTFVVQHKQPSFFNEESELSTSTLFLLSQALPFTREHIDDKNYRVIPFKTHDFYREIGYCNHNYQTLTELHGSYAKAIPSRLSSYILQDTGRKMKKFTQTVLSQMKRQGLLDWSYSKAWIEHVYDENTSRIIDTIEHVATIEEKGRIMEGMNHAFNKWNEKYPEKKLKNIYGIYMVLSKSEREKVFDWARDYIREYIPKYEYSYSTYEVIFIPQVIIRELFNRGFTEDELFNNYSALEDGNDKSQIKTVNGKFMNYSTGRLKDKFYTDMEAYNEWERTHRPIGLVRNFTPPKEPYVVMEDERDLSLGMEFIKGTLDKLEKSQVAKECLDATKEHEQ